MHDDPNAPLPIYKEGIPQAFTFVVAALGLWLAVMGGGGAIFAATSPPALWLSLICLAGVLRAAPEKVPSGGTCRAAQRWVIGRGASPQVAQVGQYLVKKAPTRAPDRRTSRVRLSCRFSSARDPSRHVAGWGLLISAAVLKMMPWAAIASQRPRAQSSSGRAVTESW